MCLSTVTASEDKNASGFGWKVFRKGRIGRLFPEIQGEAAYEIGEWYEAYGFTLFERLRYTRAFHVFTDRSSAAAWCDQDDLVVRRVQWRHQCARGTQALGSVTALVRLSTIVALEIKILPLRKAKGKKRKAKA